jgi:alpha-L-fucosidase 2
MKRTLILIKTVFLTFFLPINSHTQELQKELQLWFKQPASSWNEALPVGNGRLGAMVFGRVEHERLQLNEESVWAKGGSIEDKENGYPRPAF